MPGFVSTQRLTFGSWQAIERMVARLLRHAGFTDVEIVGGSGDKGADVVGIFRRQRWVVQVKFRYSGPSDESAAKEVVSAMNSYAADVGVAACNSSFNRSAYEYRDTVKRNGIDLRLWNGNHLIDYFEKLNEFSREKRKLRCYQKDAVRSVENERGKGKKTALVVMATGLGKSAIAAELVSNEISRNPEQEVLVLAHTTPLVRQLEQSFWSQLDKSVPTHLWTDGETPSYTGGVVFATWQSVRNDVQAGRFGLVVVDEAHHAASDYFSGLLSSLDSNFVVGLTATPWRGDGRSLTSVFGETVYSKDIVEGMQQGYLAEVDYRMLSDGIDWNEIARNSRQGHTIKDLNNLLLLPDRDEAMVELVAEKTKDFGSPRILGFCRSISHAERLRSLFASYGISAATVHNKLTREDKFRNLAAFRDGKTSLILSIEMLNEGIDVPDVNVVVFMRVTHSRRVFIQQLGRGLRLTDNKKKVLVLDFVADVRRLAAAVRLNRQALESSNDPEVIRFGDGQIVKFQGDEPLDFFDEYLADVADLEDIDDSAQLRFPELDEH